MINFLSFLNSILTNLLVIIGVFIITSGAIQTFWWFIQYEKKTKQQEEPKQLQRFSLIRSPLTANIILALPLFLIKLLDDAQKTHSSTAYLHIFGLIGILAILVIFYKKGKDNVVKKIR